MARSSSLTFGILRISAKHIPNHIEKKTHPVKLRFFMPH